MVGKSFFKKSYAISLLEWVVKALAKELLNTFPFPLLLAKLVDAENVTCYKGTVPQATFV